MAEAGKKRRRLKKDVVEFVAQFYFAAGAPTATFGQVDEMLLQLYKDYVQVNRFRRPNDELDIKSSSIATHVIKESDEELRIGATVAVEHYTVIRYAHGELRDALTMRLGLSSGSVVVTPAGDPAYKVLSNYSPEVEAVEDMKRFYSAPPPPPPSRSAPRAVPPPARQPAKEQPAPLASLIEYGKMAGALGLGLLLGVNLGRGASAAAPPPQMGSAPLVPAALGLPGASSLGRYGPLNL